MSDDVFPPKPPAEIVTGDRIATDLLRTALRGDDHLTNRAQLAICLRGALFADLALGGALGDTGRAPVVTGDPPADDRILAAVHGTVGRRANVAWKRWFRHVDVDLEALSDELVGAGRWLPTGRHVFHDRDAAAALALGYRARAVGLGEEEPESPREAVLGVLAVTAGGGHGTANPRAAVRIGDLLARFGDVPGPRLQAAHVAVGVAQLAVRRARRRVF